jgi:hypothetical protein
MFEYKQQVWRLTEAFPLERLDLCKTGKTAQVAVISLNLLPCANDAITFFRSQLLMDHEDF